MLETIFLIFILAYSIILHELAHAFSAYKLGDPTPKYEGRLTLNPLAHIDPIGTILIPLLTLFTSGFIFGWAKPVLYNPYNLKNPQKDSIYIALLGPLTNIILSIVFALLYKIFSYDPFLFGLRINLILALFNLLPIPPLDGSKILLTKIPLEIYAYLETYGFLLIIIFLLIFFQPFSIIVNKIQNFLLNL